MMLKFISKKTKKIQFIVPTLLLLLFYTTIDAQGLRNSHHDFSGASWSGGEYCKPCHTPHNANQEVPNAPLWNHQVTSAVYETYNSPTFDGIIGQPTGNSKLCLSCHDGTVPIENHGSFTGGSWYSGFGNQTTNLTNKHPISFVYDSQSASTDLGLHDPSTRLSGLGGTIEEDLLQNGRMECSSCHDPHISRNTQGCTGCHVLQPGGGFVTKSLSLWKSNDYSALCLTCHKK